MNLTFAHHEESRFNQAVFDALAAALTELGVAGLDLHDLHRVPGPLNSTFAVGLDVSRDGRDWVEEFAVLEWPALPDPSAERQATALLETIRARLAGAEPPADARRRRSWWGRGR